MSGKYRAYNTTAFYYSLFRRKEETVLCNWFIGCVWLEAPPYDWGNHACNLIVCDEFQVRDNKHMHTYNCAIVVQVLQ